MVDKAGPLVLWGLFFGVCRMEMDQVAWDALLMFAGVAFVVGILTWAAFTADEQKPRPLILDVPKPKEPKSLIPAWKWVEPVVAPPPFADVQFNHYSPIAGGDCDGTFVYVSHRAMETKTEVQRSCDKCHMSSFEKVPNEVTK